jgi:hypothetical protein
VKGNIDREAEGRCVLGRNGENICEGASRQRKSNGN